MIQLAMAWGFPANKPDFQENILSLSSSNCSVCLLLLWPQTKITDESAATGHQEGQEAKHLLSPSPTLKTSMNTQGQIAALHVPIY